MKVYLMDVPWEPEAFTNYVIDYLQSRWTKFHSITPDTTWHYWKEEFECFLKVSEHYRPPIDLQTMEQLWKSIAQRYIDSRLRQERPSPLHSV